MPVLNQIKRILLKYFIDLRWHNIVLSLLVYVAMSWLLLRLAGEAAITRSSDFIYWLMVTASTVGYGDLSPETVWGKYIVALIVIPLGLGLFGLTVGRIAAFVSSQWRRGILGLKTINDDNHVLIIGWNEGRTLQLIRLLLREFQCHTQQRRIVLCVREDMENPLPEQIGFVKVPHYTSNEDMERAGITRASCVIIDNPQDDVTMTTALFCASKNAQAHMIAYFKDDQLGHLLKQHCPNVECMPSVAVEMIAKSAVDPGSSALHHQLLNVDEGMTQYSTTYQGQASIAVRSLFSHLKESYEATLIGIAPEGVAGIHLNPALDQSVSPGSTIYYIADERIGHIDWEAFNV